MLAQLVAARATTRKQAAEWRIVDMNVSPPDPPAS
jgi:hypothetical protein